MQIVIDISEEDYAETMYKRQHSPLEMDWADRIIANGIPLPKWHGRLIDADRLKEVFERNIVGADAFTSLIDIAPTVLEGGKK